MKEPRDIIFTLTYEQAESLCDHYDKNISELEEYEICGLLDNLIDDHIS